jgi:hypothetical protein
MTPRYCWRTPRPGLRTILAGQHHVKDDEIGLFGEYASLGGVAAGLDADFEIVAGQVFGRQSGQTFVVFDKQDARGHGRQFSERRSRGP